MLKLSPNAIGMLVSKYRAVLKNMLGKSLAALAVSSLLLSVAPVWAATSYTVNSSIPSSATNFASLEDLRKANITFIDGDTIEMRNASDNSLTASLDFQGKEVTLWADTNDIRLLDLNGQSVTFANASNVKIGGSGIYFANSDYGGAVFLDNGSSFTANGVTFVDNKSYDGYGGAVHVNDNSEFTANNATFEGNTAEYGGGAVYVYEQSAFTANGAKFSDNAALNGRGGAVYVNNNSAFTADNAKFSNNDSYYGGGAVYVNDNSEFTANNASFSDNEAGSGGGAVYVYNQSAFTANGATFSDNQANYGGAVTVDTDSEFTANNAEFLTNQSQWGGAVYVYEGTFTANNAKFDSNSSDDEGGAVFLDKSTFSANGATFTNNESTYGAGGAVAIIGGNNVFSANGANFENNTANGGGGAVYIEGDNDTFTADNATFYQNESTTSSGGAVSIATNSIFTANNAKFIENTAGNSGGAVLVNDNSTFTANGAEFSDNKASTSLGGAVSILNDSAFTANDATFSGNVADYNGGAVALAWNSNFTADNTIFSGNTSTTGLGGAVSVEHTSTFSANNAAFENNKADSGRGGAIYSYESTINLSADAGKTTSFKGNTDSSGANSVYFSGGLQDANNLNVGGAGTIDMEDPFGALVSENFNVNKDGSGTWKLGGNSLLQAGMGTNFNVNGGNLYLYDGASITLDNGGTGFDSFNIAQNGMVTIASTTPQLRIGNINPLVDGGIYVHDAGEFVNNGFLNLVNPNATQMKTVSFGTNYSGSGRIGINAYAGSGPSNQWMDYLDFSGDFYIGNNISVDFNFLQGSSLNDMPKDGLIFAILPFADGEDKTFSSFRPHRGAYELKVTMEDNQYYRLSTPFNPSLGKIYSEVSASALGKAANRHGISLFKSLSQAAAEADGKTPGIYIGYERDDLRYKTGSHADIDGNDFTLALAWKTNDKTAWGIFGQKFNGSYKTSSDASLGGSNYNIKADGSLKQHTVGLFFERRPDPGHYYNAVFSLGHSSSDFNADSSLWGSRFSIGQGLTNFSLGGGYVKNPNSNRSTEFYNHLIYNRLGSDNVTDSLGQNIEFNSADSLRLLSGMRFNFNQNQKTHTYLGAAIDYEFSGRTNAHIDGNKADSADLKGLTGILEVGFNSKQNNSFTIDGSLKGYMGKKRGLGGMLMLSKKF